MAAPAGAATLTSPVIHEPFTALPCTGTPRNRTTLQLEGCAEQAILTSDKEIDGINEQIFVNLTTASERLAFITGHNAWLAYRRTFCTSASDVFGSGTITSVIYLQCVKAINADHIKELNEFPPTLGN